MKFTEATLPARRRTQRPLSGTAFLEEVRNLSIDWHGKTVRLERNSLLDYWQQSASTATISELYHENSKLFESLTGELLASRTNVRQLTEVVAARRASALSNGSYLLFDPPQQLRQLLEAGLSGLPSSALFAFDVRIAAGTTLAIYEPMRKVAYVLKTIAPPEFVAVHRALAIIGQKPSPSPGGILLFLVASFARNQTLYGSRGYRRTLMEGGRLIEHMLSRATEFGLASDLWFEFADRHIDDFVEADGIEEATIAVLEIRCGKNASES